MNEKILLVEDDVALASLVSRYLTSHGMQVFLLHHGVSVPRVVQRERPDAVILDIMLPDVDGLSVLRKLREFWRGPVLMLTALGEDSDMVAGLEIGADDYIVKPVTPRVLLARVRALLRRSSNDLEAEMIDLGSLRIDAQGRTAILDGISLDLTTAEFDLLLLLARRAGRVQERARLLEEVRGIDFISFDRSVDVLVSRLRKKLGDHSDLIKTVQGVGYCLSPGKNGSR